MQPENLPEGWERGDELDVRYPYIINWNARSKDDTIEGLGTLSMSFSDRDTFDAWINWFRGE